LLRKRNSHPTLGRIKKSTQEKKEGLFFALNKPTPRLRLIPHALLAVYALILGYVIFGLFAQYTPSPDIFVDLSIALLLFALAQSLYEMGLDRTLTLLAVALGISFAMEVLGTRTGLPFGKYHYTSFLGSEVLSVPIAVPLVWFVISYLGVSIVSPLLTKGNRGMRPNRAVLVIAVSSLAAFGAMSWDLLLDPMFTSYGYWVWDPQVYSIPKISGIPITNFVGWFVTTFVILSAFLIITFGSKEKVVFKEVNTLDSRAVYILLATDGVIANLALNHQLVAIVGGLFMSGFVAVSFMLERGIVFLKVESKTKGVDPRGREPSRTTVVITEKTENELERGPGFKLRKRWGTG
jgi:uncharacterized membrane protein